MRRTSRAFWITDCQRGELRNTPLHAATDQSVLITTHYSGISRGTERLVFEGRIPESERERMRAPFQAGEFPWPVKYGYSAVGRAETGPLAGQMVFCLHPHQDCFLVPEDAITPLPAGLPPARAVLAANMETALNGVWDAAPRIGDRITIIGAGVVGLLVASLCKGIVGTDVEVIDPAASRTTTLSHLGLDHRLSAEEASRERDVIIHASGHPKGLETALTLAGQEGRIIEMSWYGSTAVPLMLGQTFHSRRLTLRSSQVGTIAPDQQPRWNYRRRLEKAMALLCDERFDTLINGESPFEHLPEHYADIVKNPDTLCHRVSYC
ncbi:zinc-dependent alcohol dehydrogenase [Larsenimonas rhizosphaerae]|uniref:Zinc-binding alcohol dehydrogenase n=1 Tax=Larsenimonas rhizosphaerae TaxID=2944682 RepID=A0AA42CTG3_9GAMM|nr:zinc-binding alcohol dehydrogenase [Larsenimonas rhizosphaerae]MCX2523026.1 zinc-binding alcohol dehydrogenase [Larsenimonas rhizosphaerae]